jgi:hypothetical protein
MKTVLLDDLAQRIRQQEAQLQALRRELETRQRQLAQFSQRKEQLLTQLEQVDAEIAGLAGGTPAVQSSKAIKPARTHGSSGQSAPNGAVAQPAKGGPRSRGTPADGPGRRNGRAGQPSLASLIVTLLREAGRPLTVKELGQELKRRGFQSQSRNFPRMLAVRTRELKLKGILQAAVGQPGFVLAQPTSAKTQKKAPPVQRNPSHPPKSGKQPPLREVLRQILKKSTKPMTGSELAAAALKVGYHSTSKSFVDVVWATVTNLEGVEHIPNQGYRLKKSPSSGPRTAVLSHKTGKRP